MIPSVSPWRLLRVPEVAARLGVSERSVERRIHSGALPAVRLGSGPKSPVRVDEAELDAWVFDRPDA